MMDALELLMQMEIPEPQTKDYKLERLSKAAGQEVLFRLKELSYSRVADIRKQHLESGDMDVHTVLAGVISPNLRDKGLLTKYQAATPAELVKKLLLPGEIAELSRAAERLSGFQQRTISEAKKNSEQTEN